MVYLNVRNKKLKNRKINVKPVENPITSVKNLNPYLSFKRYFSPNLFSSLVFIVIVSKNK